MDYIRYLGDIRIIFSFVLITCAYTLTLYSLLRFTLRNVSIPSDPYFGINIIGALVSLSAVLLIFTLIQSINLEQKIEGQINAEVSLIETLDESLSMLSDSNAKDSRLKLSRYTSMVVDQEWREMAEGRESLATEKQFDDILPNILRIEAKNKTEDVIYSHTVRVSYELAKARNARISHSTVKLPMHFWCGITFLLTINIIQFFVLAKRNNFSLLVLTLHMSTLGLILGLIFIYDHPFLGTGKDLSEPFRKIYKEIRVL